MKNYWSLFFLIMVFLTITHSQQATVQDIINLKNMGFDEDKILKVLQDQEKVILTTQDYFDMKESGFSEKFLKKLANLKASKKITVELDEKKFSVQLYRDFTLLLQQESEYNCSRIKRIEGILEGKKVYNVHVQNITSEVKEIGSPAFIPLILKTLWEKEDRGTKLYLPNVLNLLIDRNLKLLQRGIDDREVIKDTIQWWFANKESIIKNTKEIRTQVSSILEKLEQDYAALLEMEKSATITQLQSIDAFFSIVDTNTYNPSYVKGIKIIRELRSKASIPLLLRMMYMKYNSAIPTIMKDTLTILTGEDFSSYQDAENIIESWWIPNKSKVITDFSKMEKKQQLLILDKILVDYLDRDDHYQKSNTAFYMNEKLSKIRGDFFHGIRKYNDKLVPKMVPLLLELADRNSISWDIVSFLAKLRAKCQTNDLENVINDPQKTNTIRLVAALALWKVGEKNISTQKLLSILESEKNLELQLVAIIGMRNCADLSNAVPKVLNLLHSKNREIRLAVCYALRSCKPDKEDLPKCMEFLPVLKEFSKNLSISEQILLSKVIKNISLDEAKNFLGNILSQTLEKGIDSKHELSQTLAAFQNVVGIKWYTRRFRAEHEELYQAAKLALQWWESEKQESSSKKEPFKVQELDDWLSERVVGKNIYVKSTPSLGNGSKEEPFAKIHSALEIANSGDIIHIGAGIYKENITVGQGITIRGEHPSLVVIEGQIAGSSRAIVENISVQFNNPAIRLVGINGFVLKNCWIRNVSHQNEFEDAVGILVQDAQNIVLLQNIVYNISDRSDDGAWGILWERTTGIIANNIIGHIGESESKSVYGIHIVSCQRGMCIYNNTIAFLYKRNWDNIHGICIDSDSLAFVENNLIYDIKSDNKKGYGITNLSSKSVIAHNGIAKVAKPFSGEIGIANVESPISFTDSKNGDFRLLKTSTHLGIANSQADPQLKSLSPNNFENQLGAFGGYFAISEEIVQHLREFSPIIPEWKDYEYSFDRKMIYLLKQLITNDTEEKQRVWGILLSHSRKIRPLVKMILDGKAPKEFDAIDAKGLLEAIDKAHPVYPWSFD